MRVVLLPLATLVVVVGVGLFRELPANRHHAVDSGTRLVELGRFQQPTYVTSPRGDRRLFVVERTGRIWIVVDGRRLRRSFIDLSRRVTTASIEDGLLSVAFAPDFAASRRLYVDFTGRRRGDSVVLEFRTKEDNRNEVDMRTARTLLRIQNPKHFHHGGLLTFGPDGLLYIGQGDGGRYPDPGLAAQRLDSLHGKILRIDPRAHHGRPYRVPSNPLVGRPGRDEIYALGFRNPWRFTFDPADGGLYVADVGGVRVEEIDRVPKSVAVAANYGWPCREGVEVFRTVPYAPPRPDKLCPRALPPIFQIIRAPHSAYAVPPKYSSETNRPVIARSGRKARVHFLRGVRACAIVGGVFVRDRRLSRLFGQYLLGDFCNGTVQSLRISGCEVVDAQFLDLSVPALSSFGEERIRSHLHRLARRSGLPPGATIDLEAERLSEGASWSLLDLFVYTCFAITPITAGLWLYSFAPVIGGNLILALLVTAGAAVCGAAVYAFLAARLPRMGGEYVWQSSLLFRPLGFVVAVTAWWFAVVNLAPVFGNLLIAEVGDPLLAELKADGARSWLHGSSGAFATSLIVIIIAAVAASLRLSTYARIQHVLFAIGILAVVVCVGLLLAHSRLDFQGAFDRETVDLYGANEVPSVTTLSGTPLSVQLREVQVGSTVLLVPLIALSLMLVGWGNPLSAEIRGITRRGRTFVAVAGAVIFSTLVGFLLLLAIGKGMGWTFWNAENDDYWGAVYGYRTAPPLGSWPSPIMQAGWLVKSSAFQVGLLLAAGAWFVGWIGTLFLSSARVLLVTVTRGGPVGHPRANPPERVVMLLVLPAVAISALSAYWDAFARQSAAAVAIPFAVAGIASSLAALTVVRNASRSVFVAAAVFTAFLVFILVRWIQASVYAMGPAALAYAGVLYVLAVIIYGVTTSAALRGKLHFGSRG